MMPRASESRSRALQWVRPEEDEERHPDETRPVRSEMRHGFVVALKEEHGHPVAPREPGRYEGC